MNKVDLAAYCASLSTLLKDQDSAGGNLRSATLADEFNRHFTQLKEKIRDETRQSIPQQHRGDENRTDFARG